MEKSVLDNYIKAFLEENSKLNLVSKNDEKLLFEKHISDSLAIKKFFEQYSVTDFADKKLLDIGTGGGFPSVPIALEYPELRVVAVDSIGKKIRAITSLKEKLGIKNLEPKCIRVEMLRDEKFDFITSRAVAPLKTLVTYALPLLKDDGFFLAYKSVKCDEEILDAKEVLNKYDAKVENVMEYDLPLSENHTRKLIIIKKKKFI